MKNLKVWQKLVLLGAIFMIPFAGVTYVMISSINELNIEFAQQESRGVQYYTPLLALLKDVQQHRGMSAAWLNGDASFKDLVTAKNADIEKDIAAVSQADQSLDSALHTTKEWTALSASIRDLVAKTPSWSGEQSYQEHTKLINSIITLISDVSDASKLTLDPDLDSYYLMDVIMFKGPNLSEAVGECRSLGTGIAAAKAGTPEQFDSLNRETILMRFLHGEMDDSVQRALTANATLKPQLGDLAQTTANGITAAEDSIKTLTSNGKVTVSATDYYAAMTKSLDHIYELEARSSESLQTLLNNRIDKWQNVIYWALAKAGLGLLAVCIFGYFIMRNITRPLAEVVAIANKIADGDLAVPPLSESRKDELGVLADAFDRMIAKLKEVVGVAENIASGNLAVTVKPRSARDVMGNTFARMIENLSQLVGQVQKSGIQVNTSVTEIAATSKQQQATASEIAATTTEISATSKEISATSKELVRTMDQVSTVADQSATLAGSGQTGLSRMEETMRRVMDAATSINARLTVLNEKAGNINQVVTTITKVADQTNLLSLNAAIEAEKAGEYGRGFAVVATEIRRLADQTAVATHDIEQMVKEIQSAVSAGVMGMDKFSEEVRRGMSDVQQVGGQLTQIIQQVQALAPRFEAVNEGMQAQATGAEQITEALAQLSDAAQQTVESLRQSNQVIDGLNQASVGLRSGVSRFKLEA